MKTFTKRLLTKQKRQTQVTESDHVTTTSSVPCVLPTSYLVNRLLFVVGWTPREAGGVSEKNGYNKMTCDRWNGKLGTDTKFNPMGCREQRTGFFLKNQKSSPIFSVTHRDRGGNRNTHYPGKWIVSVCLRTEYPVQPLLYLSISKGYQLSSTDPPVSTVG